ncbi:MAG: DNA recombination protein RmuC [Microbacteriaceae bacterium]
MEIPVAVIAVVALAVGLALGVVLGMLGAKLLGTGRLGTARLGTARSAEADPAVLAARHEAELAGLRAEEQSARARVAAQLAAAEASLAALREQLALAQGQYRDLVERARREAEERQAAERAESRVLQALTPVQETLRTMQSKVAELETQRSQQHGELAEQIRSTRQSAELSRAAAETLASALSNNAVRGAWGETQLRSLVESAGLLNRVDFTLQTSISAESGARRPDMVVNLPGGKSIAVDAKVPYADYMEAAAIPATAPAEQAAQRAARLSAHAKKVKAHVDALASKSYWTGLAASPEFTIAFIPNEPLLAAALEHDPTLMEYAFGKRIALASPVSFWAVLKTVAFTWQQDVLTEDAKRLFDLSKTLYSRIATLAEHADRLRRSIESTVSSYNQFASSLEQRVLVTARQLDALDESKVIGSPAAVETVPRPLTAAELA